MPHFTWILVPMTSMVATWSYGCFNQLWTHKHLLVITYVCWVLPLINMVRLELWAKLQKDTSSYTT